MQSLKFLMIHLKMGKYHKDYNLYNLYDFVSIQIEDRL